MYELEKRGLEFVWDPAKDRTNQLKHGVSFAEAVMVFKDECGALFIDPDESDEEDRYILIGLSEKMRLLVICHCYRESDSVIRIISARKADRRETAAYAKN